MGEAMLRCRGGTDAIDAIDAVARGITSIGSESDSTQCDRIAVSDPDQSCPIASRDSTRRCSFWSKLRASNSARRRCR